MAPWCSTSWRQRSRWRRRRPWPALRSGAYDGHLNASTAARLTSLLRYATGALPVEGYEAEMGKVGTPSAIAADLIVALGTAIDELTRPIDAIKHQAKTVTVGISRSEGSAAARHAGGRDALGRRHRGVARLPGPAHACCPRAGRRGGPRLHALCHRDPCRARPRRRGRRGRASRARR